MTKPLDSAPEADAARRRIQRSRNIVLGLILGAFVILIFAISMAKMG
jgi:hypothetical protein